MTPRDLLSYSVSVNPKNGGLPGLPKLSPDPETTSSDKNQYHTKTARPVGEEFTGTVVCFQSFEIVEDEPILSNSCGFRLFDGKVWLEVTPFLLGWMSAAIVRQLNSASEDAGDLAASIDLFHRARDSSGLSPVEPPKGWQPPGLFERPIPDAFAETSKFDAGAVGRLSRWNSRDDWSGRGKSQAVAGDVAILGEPVTVVGGHRFAAGSVFDVRSSVFDDFGEELLNLGRDDRLLISGVSRSRLHVL